MPSKSVHKTSSVLIYFFPRFFISHFYKVSILPSRFYDFSLLWFPRTLPHYAPNVLGNHWVNIERIFQGILQVGFAYLYLIILLPVELQEFPSLPHYVPSHFFISFPCSILFRVLEFASTHAARRMRRNVDANYKCTVKNFPPD